MAANIIKASLYHQHDCQIGEGPFWYDGKLWWIDAEEGKLFSAGNQGQSEEVISFGQQIGAVAPTQNGRFLVALEREIAELDIESKSWTVVARAEDIPKGSRFNDGKVDPQGRFLVGTMSLEGRKGTSALYCLENDRSLRRLKSGLSVSNGLAWSFSGTTMYLIDTPENCVFSYDYNLEEGTLSGEKVVLRFPKADGMPDGMTIDQEGRLWIGFWDGWAVRCYVPSIDQPVITIEVPCARATSCCFGGPKLEQLFITTARKGLTESEIQEQLLAGSVFVCDPRTCGAPLQPFGILDRLTFSMSREDLLIFLDTRV